MGALKLFISHSSRLDDDESSDDPAVNPNLKLLLEVIELIKQEYGDTIEVLIDKDEHGLPAGHDWEKRLNEWLAECHAAVILFSKRALENSNWVKKEASILSWRRELEENFILIPVCLKGQTTPEELKKDLFGTLRIDKDQCIHDAINRHDILVGIKLALGDKEFLHQRCKSTPFDKLKNVISKLLSKNADSNTLEDAWGALAPTDKPAWHSDSKVKFSQALTRYLFRNGEHCLNDFENLIKNIIPKIDQKHALEILEYIRPLWVKAQAAGCIRVSRSESSQTPNQFLAMNGKLLSKFTLERYSERAWPMDKDYKLVFTTSAEESTLIKQIRKKFQPKRIELEPEECDNRIKTYNRQILVYLPASEQEGGGILDDSVLRVLLQKKYPDIIFILGTGEQLPATVADEIAIVEPQLDLQLEHDQMIAEANTEDFLDDFYGNE